MKKYFVPLGVFVVGMLGLLLSTIMYPTLYNTSSNLSADTAAIASNYWGWTWASNPAVVIAFVFICSVLAIAYMAARKFLSQR